jgi:hypothetical protein
MINNWFKYRLLKQLWISRLRLRNYINTCRVFCQFLQKAFTDMNWSFQDGGLN